MEPIKKIYLKINCVREEVYKQRAETGISALI